ncbi:MAG TPA: hypothetical protein VGC08_02685 [Pedobacter sp.]
MKSILSIFLLSVTLLSCQKKEEVKTYTSRSLNTTEDFNQYIKQEGTTGLTIVKTDSTPVTSKDGSVPEDRFIVKFRDTTVNIQNHLSDKSAVASQFSAAEFLNTQKTALLVQVADNSGLVAPFYLISLKGDKLDVVSLYRPSNGKDDRKFTKGLSKIGRSGYLINNDFFITTVNAKVYTLKRQSPEERIQGLHFVTSSDKNTLVFMESSALYEVHYPSGEAFTQPLPSTMPKDRGSLYSWIQNNFSWKKNAAGISFLKADKDDNSVVDISAFKKS